MFSAITFNMQNGQVWDEKNPDETPISLAAAANFLAGENADLIFLQEVERGFDGGEQVEPPPHYSWLRDHLTGYHSVFGYPLRNPLEIPFGLGLAIFSRTPLHNFFRVDLPAADLTFEFDGVTRRPSSRLLIGAETQIEGHPLRLLNTHLQAFFMIKASSDQHREQRDLVEKELRRDAQPCLLAGDFNCGPGETLVEQFAGVGFKAAQNDQVTWRRMPFILDHIFSSDHLRVEKCEVIPTLASDHHAVRSEFSFIS